MLRTVITPCQLPKAEADALNHASGLIYSQVMVTHWRALRHSDHWISAGGAEKLNDWQNRDTERLLHAHSIDAAQQGFAKACKTARTNQAEGNGKPRYPYKRKWYRTTIWKTSGIRQHPDHLLLARARGHEPICVSFTTEGKVREVRLVYDLRQEVHVWHLVVEDGIVPVPVENGVTAAIDLGEIHPVAITDGKEVCILSCRELRSLAQQTCKELEHLQKKLSRCTKGSKRAKRLQCAKKKMLARQKRRRRDLEHKISRATVQWCQEHNVGALAIGDVRDVADKTKAKGKSNVITRQKLSHWSHGTLRKYLGYKSTAEGIQVHDAVPEHHTSQTCLKCGKRTKARGRNYRCSDPECQFAFPRDGVGSANLLSRFVHGELAKVRPTIVKYRRPFQKWKGLRSPEDTRQVANAS
jgi:putative transposase